jgi:ABC-type multidrug transport system fused ATPase/permease subunit
MQSNHSSLSLAKLARSRSAHHLFAPVLTHTDSNRPSSVSDASVTYGFISRRTPRSELLAPARAKFYDDLNTLAPLPGKYRFYSKETAMLGFDLTCALAGCVLYAAGGATKEDMVTFLGFEFNMNVAGSLYVNFVQNILYAHCVASAANNFKNENKFILAWAFALGIITSFPPTAAMFRMGIRRDYSIPTTLFLTTAQFLGTFPLSFFGMYDATKRVMRMFGNNPRVREFLLEQLTEHVEDSPELKKILVTKDNPGVRRAGLALGSVIAFSQFWSMISWVCDSESLLNENMGFPVSLSWILSALVFNLPSELIAVSFSGFDVGDSLTQAAYEYYQAFENGADGYTSTREYGYDIAFYLLTFITLYFSMYSSATAVSLFDECPSFGIFNEPLKLNVDEGTNLFNFVMTMIALSAMISYFKRAYARMGSMEYTRNQLRSGKEWICSEDSATLEEIAESYFPEQDEEWEQPRSSSTSSWMPALSRFSVFGNASRQGYDEIEMQDRDGHEDVEVTTDNGLQLRPYQR